jgi:hypothetical protein
MIASQETLAGGLFGPPVFLCSNHLKAEIAEDATSHQIKVHHLCSMYQPSQLIGA